MEKKGELLKCDDETVPKCDELKCSSSEKLQEERILPIYVAGEENISKSDILCSESKMVESQNMSQFSESSKDETTSKLNINFDSNASNTDETIEIACEAESLNFSESSKDETASKLNVSFDSNASNSDETIEIACEAIEFMKLFEKHKTALKELTNTDSKTPNKISSETPKKRKPKSKKPVSTKTRVCNLQTLISNEETREIGLFYSLLAGKDVGSVQSSKTSSKNPHLEFADKSKSSKLDRKLKSSELEKKSKSSQGNRKSKHSDSNRKSKSSEVKEKSKPSELEIKSKSVTDSESLEPIISTMLKTLQDIKLPETSEVDDMKPCEGATASIQSEKEDLFSESKHEIENYFSLFQEKKTAASPTGSSDSGTLTPGSDDPESKTSSPERLSKSFTKSKLSRVSAKSNLPESSARSNLSKSSIKSKLMEQSTEPYVSEVTVPKLKLPRESGGSKLPRQSGGSKLPKESGGSKLPRESGGSKLPRDSGASKSPDECAKSELCDQPARPKFSDQSVRAKISNVSGRSKQSDQKMKSKQSDPYVTSNLSDSSLKSKMLDPSAGDKFTDSSAKSKLPKRSSWTVLSDPLVKVIRGQLQTRLVEPNEEFEEKAGLVQSTDTNSQQCAIELNEFVKSRRDNFLDLHKSAKRVKAFMDQGVALKQDYKLETKFANTLRRQEDADDWMKLIFYWDLVTEEMDMIVEVTDLLYDSDGNMLMTSDEFHDFMRNILVIFRDIVELIYTCQNGLIKFTRFCSSHDMYKFLSQSTFFESRVAPLVKKIKNESQMFTNFKKVS